MTPSVIDQVIQKYELAYQQILPPQKGFRNTSYAVLTTNGQWLNIIIYKSEPGILTKIKNANAVSDFLVTQDFPTRQTVGQILQLRKTPQTCSVLYTYLPGSAIPWDAYTMRHLKLLGGMMSQMHYALTDFRSSTLPSVIDISFSLERTMQGYFARPEVQRAVLQKLRLAVSLNMLKNFLSLLHACRTLSPQQALHMDFVRGNILFAGKAEHLVITGLLDFEKTAFGPKIFDIARTFAFLLVDCKYKTEEKIRKYFLYSGYNKRGAACYEPISLAISDKNIDALEALVDFFLMYDFYKFLAHNPYESLWQNEHFVATRDLMLRRNLITMLE